MSSDPSFYFTLFKKFQVLDHVPSNSVHGSAGAPTGGFGLTNSNAIFTGSNRGLPITLGSSIPADSPLWAVLNSRAAGNGAFTPVNVNGVNWPTMPPGTPLAWTEFQVNAPPPKLVDAFANWIQGSHRVNDTPNAAIATRPAAFAAPVGGIQLFVCSMPGDQGGRPGVPPDFWATSLISLVDPATGATVNPPTLTSASEWFLSAVIGNRGQTNAGRFIGAANAVEAAASVMVWNTFDSPGVQLPALSNLDVNDKNGIYEQYFLRSGNYDVVGFRLNVQTVFNGIVAALTDAVANGLDLGGMTPAEWVHAQPAHLCSKVVVREHGTAFPSFGVTPDQDARIAQKNLAPFDINLVATDPAPNINWKNFIVGQPLFLKMSGGGANRLTLRKRLRQDALDIYLAVPRAAFERLLRKGRIDGYAEMARDELCQWDLWHRARPFPEAVILRATGDDPTIEFAGMPEGQYAAMALGIAYDIRKLRHGEVGAVTMVQETVLPRAVAGSLSFELARVVVGGFTLVVRAVDAHIAPDGKRHDFPDR